MPRPRSTTVDVRRIGLATSYPGIDPRTWVSAGRLDDDPEALRWDEGAGWVVDVSFYGTELDGDAETPCRVLTTGPAGAGFGEYLPPVPGCELLVALADGDPESNPVVLGYLRNSETCPPPSTINGLPILPDAFASTPLTVSPYDTELKRSPYTRREEYGPLYVLEAGEIRLGGDDGLEPALLGQTSVDNMNELLQGLTEAATALSLLVGPLAPIATIGQNLLTALQALAPKIAGELAQVVSVK